jgi:mono/diheme cytochrome c family protein
MLVFVACVVLASLWFLGGDALHSSALGSAPEAQAPATPEQIERGSYLARVGNCAHCHTARDGLPYAGGRAIDTPFGQVLSTNITPDRLAGIGTWSAQDFWRALHHGMAKDGRALYPAFPYTSFTRISRADSDALFAYLQSVPEASTLRQPHALRWPYNTALALRVWRALYFKPAASVPTAPTDVAARGAYLVDGLGHCMECHAARNALGAMASSGKGGAVLPGSQWFAPALNDPAQGSVAAWSEAETVRFLQTGINALAQASGPMADVVLHGTQYLSDADAQAMAVHLRALPQAAAAPTATDATAANGAQLYTDHCAACHGLQGLGQPGAYPALAGNRAVTLTPTNNLVLTVLGGGFGPSTHGNPQPFGMPPYMLQLNEAEIAAVLTYVRNAWGNQAAPVSALDVNTQSRVQVN